MKPHFGQVSEYGSDVSVNKQPWDVFQVCEQRSYFVKYSCGFRPHVPFVVFALLLASGAERLAREPGSDDIHFSTPWHTVECSNIVPDWERLEVSFLLSP
jgi:hypothetical protein